MHSTESRLVIGPPNILFLGVYVSIFQPGNFTGWGSEVVKKEKEKKFTYFFHEVPTEVVGLSVAVIYCLHLFHTEEMNDW